MTTTSTASAAESGPQQGTGSVRHDTEVIGLIGLAHGTSHFYHLLLPPLFPWLMADFGLSFTQAGLLMSVFFVVSGLGQAVAGFVVDRIGAQRALFGGLALLSASALLLGLAQSYPMLMLVVVIAGLGNCVFHPADFTLLNHNVAPARLGHAFSVHGLIGNLGWAAAPVFMVGIASWAGWHAAAFAAASVAALVFAVLWWRRDTIADVRHNAEQQAAAAQAPFAFLSSSAVWMCFAFFFLTTMAFGILQNYAPAIFERLNGLSLSLATAALTAYLLGSAAGMVAGGFLAARTRNNDHLIAAALAGSAVMALLLASGWLGGDAVLPLMALMGLGVGMAGPSRDLLIRKAAASRFGKTSFGRVYGFVYSGLDAGQALAPLLIGPWLDAGHFALPLAAVAGLQVAALFTALRVGRDLRYSNSHVLSRRAA
ncbi:MAG: MFS transporter [Burkholderiaceae bacterium]